VKVDAMTLMGEFLKAGPKNKGTRGQPLPPGPGRGSRQKTGSANAEPPVSNVPTHEQLFGPGGKKAAQEAQALATLKAEAPEEHERVRAGEVTVREAFPAAAGPAPRRGRRRAAARAPGGGRQKTNEQLGREAQALLKVEEERAKKRQQEAGKTHGRGQKLPERVPEAIATGDARDKVGEALGVSGRHAEKAAQVVEAIDHLAGSETAGMEGTGRLPRQARRPSLPGGNLPAFSAASSSCRFSSLSPAMSNSSASATSPGCRPSATQGGHTPHQSQASRWRVGRRRLVWRSTPPQGRRSGTPAASAARSRARRVAGQFSPTRAGRGLSRSAANSSARSCSVSGSTSRTKNAANSFAFRPSAWQGGQAPHQNQPTL
jgi:hypothetical protein